MTYECIHTIKVCMCSIIWLKTALKWRVAGNVSNFWMIDRNYAFATAMMIHVFEKERKTVFHSIHRPYKVYIRHRLCMMHANCQLIHCQNAMRREKFFERWVKLSKNLFMPCNNLPTWNQWFELKNQFTLL